MAWDRNVGREWPPDDWLARDPKPWWGWRLAGWLLVFMLGGAAGFFARDLGAKPEVARAAEDVRREVARTADQAAHKARELGTEVQRGVQAAAESVKAKLP